MSHLNGLTHSVSIEGTLFPDVLEGLVGSLSHLEMLQLTLHSTPAIQEAFESCHRSVCISFPASLQGLCICSSFPFMLSNKTLPCAVRTLALQGILLVKDLKWPESLRHLIFRPSDCCAFVAFPEQFQILSMTALPLSCSLDLSPMRCLVDLKLDFEEMTTIGSLPVVAEYGTAPIRTLRLRLVHIPLFLTKRTPSPQSLTAPSARAGMCPCPTTRVYSS